jgi:hypothetical protein
MIQIIIGADVETRIKKRNNLLLKISPTGGDDVIFLDDMSADIALLERYAFPSLFSISSPVVYARYLLEQYQDQLTKELLKTLVASPTFFLLEERSVPAVFLKNLEKAGAIIHLDKPVKSLPKQTTIFNVTNAITSKSKKDRWLSYRKALEEHPVEAIIGILYWKLRQLIEGSPKNQDFKIMYSAFMKAHKTAWQKGFPLELAIEKVILEQ